MLKVVADSRPERAPSGTPDRAVGGTSPGWLAAGLLALVMAAGCVPAKAVREEAAAESSARPAPRKPLHDLSDPLIIGHWVKLGRLANSHIACLGALSDAGVRYDLAPAKSEGVCGHDDAVTVRKSVTTYSKPLTLTCPLAATLNVWERHVVMPAAERRLGTKVIGLEVMGSYSCRNIAGTEKVSEHGRANAVDIAGFRLADGRVLRIKDDFYRNGPEGAFLREVRSGACDLFTVTLSPDYNAAHADHLHLDVGRWPICR